MRVLSAATQLIAMKLNAMTLRKRFIKWPVLFADTICRHAASVRQKAEKRKQKLRKLPPSFYYGAARKAEGGFEQEPTELAEAKPSPLAKQPIFVPSVSFCWP